MPSGACFHLMPSTPVPLHLPIPCLRAGPCPESLSGGPLTIFWVLSVATWPQCGLTDMAAEAAPVVETAIGTQAFQDIEAFPTKCTQILATSLHPSPCHRVSWKVLPYP